MAPTGLYRHLSRYFKNTEEEILPPLSATFAGALSVAYTVLYVLPFYLSPTTRPSPTLSRDAPSVIRARIRFVSISVALSTIATIYILADRANATRLDILRLLGWYPIGILEVAKSLLLTALLFAGPLFESASIEGRWKDWIQGQTLHQSLSSWIGWRNYVAGPVTEEILFRSLLVPLHLLTPLSPTHVIFFTPLYFGIAHVHHFYEFVLTHPHTPWAPSIIRSLIQFTYTTIFGWYATFLFIRTGSVFAVILVHTFCNWAGLPRLWGRVEPRVAIGGPTVRGKEDSGSELGQERRGSLVWSLAYYTLLVAGAVGFQQCLWDLTESPARLAKIE
ncbi:MAG: hypothetical protein L6R40_006288 [Gallowayella cf. fulva]|nr:MAG: hypothetical protein L6R40_006288 [Xanthomendoza cf. fulva]